MSRFPSKVFALFAGVAMVLVVSQLAIAQPPEGGRGRGRGGRGPGGMGGGFFNSTIDLVGLEQVESELKLTEDQKAKVKEITDNLQDERRELRQREDEFNREEMDKLNSAAAAKLTDVLDEGQQKRLVGILVQVNLGASLRDSGVAKELNITDDQKSKLDEAAQEIRSSMRDAMEDLRDLSPEERREKMTSLRAESDKKFLAVLTSDQQSQLDQLKGEKFELDMSQLRGRGGPGGRGEGGSGRGGRRGERGERGPSGERAEAGAPESSN